MWFEKKSRYLFTLKKHFMANIQLSDHFNYRKLLRFTLPSVAMMIFTSIYSVVDGVFVSNFVGKTPFAAIKDIDIAFLPCNQPYTMTPEQLVRAAKLVKPKVLFPYHYGETDIKNIPSQLQGDGIDVRIRHYE